MKIGNLLVNAAYLGERVLTAIAVGATKVWEGVSKYIKFKDPVVEQLCMKWSSDGVGLTPEDAAAVTDIGTTFQGNTEITSFEELDRFGVTELKTNCFYNCVNLTSVNLSKIEVMGNFTFENSGLQGVVRMPSLKRINSNGTFLNTKITEVDDFGAITALNGPNTFKGCESLKRCNLPSSLVDISMSSAGSVFAYTPLEFINLENVERIGTNAFLSCTSLNIILELPNLKSVGYNSFALCGSLKADLIVPKLEETDRYCFEEIGISKVLDLGIIETLASSSFLNCKALNEVILPSTLKEIGERAFDGCSSLATLLCNTSVPPVLGNNALRNTASSLSIYVPDDSVEAYKSATNWSAYADQIKPLSEYVEPTTE